MKNEILKQLALEDFSLPDDIESGNITISKEFDVNNLLVTVDVTFDIETNEFSLDPSDWWYEIVDKSVSDIAVYDYSTEEEIEIEFTNLELNNAIK